MAEQVSSSRRGQRSLLAAALLLAVAAPAEAQGSTALVQGSALVYVAEGGEHNQLRVEAVDGAYRLSDDVAIQPGTGCERSGSDVVCAAARVALVQIDVGDRDDHVEGPPGYLVEPLRVEMRGGEGDDVLESGIWTDNLQEGGPGADTLIAGDSAYVLRGGDGDDRLLTGVDGGGSLEGGAGDDYIEPEGGRETIAGGPGLDTLSYRLSCCQPSGPAVVTLDGVANDGDDGPGGRADNVGSDVEVIGGSPGADSFAGDAGANTFHGLDGEDTLAGGAGADYLYGEGGDDRLTGGAGTDQLDGGRGSDTLDSRDGAPDSVVCGPDVDSVVADPSDAVAGDCELRDIAAAPAAPSAPAPLASTAAGGVAGAVARAPRVSVARRATLRGRVMRLQLRCSSRTVTGRVSVTARIAERARSLGLARFRCAPRGAAVASIRLRAGQRRLLVRAERVRLTLRITSRDSGGRTARTTVNAALRS